MKINIFIDGVNSFGIAQSYFGFRLQKKKEQSMFGKSHLFQIILAAFLFVVVLHVDIHKNLFVLHSK